MIILIIIGFLTAIGMLTLYFRQGIEEGLYFGIFLLFGSLILLHAWLKRDKTQ